MKEKKFYNIFEVGSYMYDVAEGGKTIAAVVFEQDAIDLFQFLIDYDIEIGAIFIDGDYDKEYYVTLTDELIMNIVPVFIDEGEMLGAKSDIMLFDGDASSKISFANDCEQYEIVYDFEEDEDDCCEDCCEDCSNCNKRLAVEALNTALDLFDYILNQYDDE